MKRRFPHSPETDAIIREGYERLEAVADIAARLGCTRSVVIGRAYRLGLCEAGHQFNPLATKRRSASMRATWNDRWFDPERRAQRIAPMQAGRRAWRIARMQAGRRA